MCMFHYPTETKFIDTNGYTKLAVTKETATGYPGPKKLQVKNMRRKYSSATKLLATFCLPGRMIGYIFLYWANWHASILHFCKYLALLQVSCTSANILHFCKYLALLQISCTSANILHFCKYLALLQVSCTSWVICTSWTFYRGQGVGTPGIQQKSRVFSH